MKRQHRRSLRRRYGHAGGAEPWSAKEAAHHSAIARQMFFRGHDYPHGSKLEVANCGYCALTSGGSDGPNYSGWARLYIEAKKPIPSKWRAAFQRELDSDNRAYANALMRSIATFGGPRFV